MQNFTSVFNEKEITFTGEGIRYNNEIFIAYRDMRDISHRTEGQNALVFRYKDRLVRLQYNPNDKPEIMPFLAIAMQKSKDAEKEEEARRRSESAAAVGITLPETMAGLDKYAYLDGAPQPPQMAAPQPKKKHTGLIVGLVIALVVVAAVVAIIILR